jgi:hypothetical protein
MTVGGYHPLSDEVNVIPLDPTTDCIKDWKPNAFGTKIAGSAGAAITTSTGKYICIFKTFL